MGQPFCKYLWRLSNTLWRLLWTVTNTLWLRIRMYWQPSGEYVLFAKVANTLWGICQRAVSDTQWQICLRVANTLLPLVTNLPERVANNLWYFQQGCPNYTQRDNLCAIPLKRLKFKVKNLERMKSYETIRGSSPNKALSINTTNSPSQSREIVPLIYLFSI